MATVNLEKVSKVYPNGLPAVSELDLDVAEGELMVLVGPSGSGKTTALRMVAGLEDITSGTLRMGGKAVNDLPPKDRNVAMVFQNYALYPHMTVAQNIGFALKLRKFPKAEINTKVREAAQLLGLSDYLNSKPGQLSGGQRQRVAMGRAIVREPSVFLMDEPLSNLDAKLRVQMRAEISRIQRRVGVATLYVTHDQVEAMTMGDRVAVLHMGRLQQCDSPQSLYEHPDNLFVAAFIGSPAMNCTRPPSPQTPHRSSWAPSRSTCPRRCWTPARLSLLQGPQVVIGIRPEHLLDAALGRCRRRHNPERRRGADRGPRQRAAGALLARRDACAFRRRPAAAETGELEGLQSLQSGGVRAAGVARVSPAASSRPARVPHSPSTPSGSTSSTTTTGQPSGLEGPGLWATSRRQFRSHQRRPVGTSNST